MVKLLLAFGLLAAVRRSTIAPTALPVPAKIKPEKVVVPVVVPVKVEIKKVIKKLSTPTVVYGTGHNGRPYIPTDPQWLDDGVTGCYDYHGENLDAIERCLNRKSFT